MYVFYVTREWRLCHECAGVWRRQDCRVDFCGDDWKELLFGLRRVFAAGPAGCVDWLGFMRGAAAQE